MDPRIRVGKNSGPLLTKSLKKPQTDCPDLSRSNGKLKRKYKFDRELLKSLKIKTMGQDGKDCFGTAEIVNSGRIKSDLELFEDAFYQLEKIVSGRQKL